jgi:ATP-binding cassette subfamily C (CFTR/MRP) protein 4
MKLVSSDIMKFPFTSFVGISLAALLISLLHGQVFLLAYKIGMISRIIMTGAVYQKVLSLNQVTVGRLSIGRIVNLASNDVQRLDLVCCSSLLLMSLSMRVVALH